MSEYRAFIEPQPHAATAKLYVSRLRHDGYEILCDDGLWRTVGEGAAAPIEAGVTLPLDAIPALAEALHPHAGHKVEVARLSEALDVERRRVDSVLATITNGGTA